MPRASKPLPVRSRKTAAFYSANRIPFVVETLEARPICERCHKARSSEVHEIKTRARGGSLTDPDNVAALCHDCHRIVTENPDQAHEEGWLKHSWE